MHLDISRDTFDPTQVDLKQRHLQIFHEQGRILLDATLNQQAATMLYEMRALAADMYGRHWGRDDAFKIGTPDAASNDFPIAAGNYYVDGFRCECPAATTFHNQPFVPTLPGAPIQLPAAPYIIYLEVWERLITDAVDPYLKDPALEQLDAHSASQLVWQVKVLKMTDEVEANTTDLLRKDVDPTQGITVLKQLLGTAVPAQTTGNLAVRPVQGIDESTSEEEDGLCESELDERYRGLENQLYRIEIHQGGDACEEGTPAASLASYATFKWSRDNGSVIFPILEWTEANDSATVKLARNGRDAHSSLKAGDWVEYHDEISSLFDSASPQSQKPVYTKLHRVESVDPYDPAVITLKGDPEDFKLPSHPADWKFQDRRPFLRRWDQQPIRTIDKGTPTGSQILNATTEAHGPVRSTENNALIVVADQEAANADVLKSGCWLDIENGIRIRFSKGKYRTGDYWYIPARYATGRVLWPTKVVNPTAATPALAPVAIAPQSDQRYYAPLAFVRTTDPKFVDCRRVIATNLLPPKPVT